jgi:type IV pilus assembly protein PilA
LIIAILGILALLAIAAYQTYTVRAQVVEVINMTAGVQAAVVDAYERSGSAPMDRLEAELSADATESQSNYVTRIDVVKGRVDITFGKSAHPEIATATLSLTPYISDGIVIWRCDEGPVPGGRLLGDGGGSAVYQPGNVDRRYLPAGCR